MKKIPLTQGKFAIVDDEDYQYLMQWKWRFHNAGYAVRSIREDGKNKSILMHRQINETICQYETDHMNGNRLDNRRENLRSCLRSENQMNQKVQSRNKNSKYKGVHLYRRPGYKKWSAKIKKNGEWHYLGYFNSQEDAAIAYNKKAIEIFGSFARLNEIVV